ncbi:MAG: DUF4118 domain-containing protein [Betaproteobacteria bacterium]
MNSRTPNDDFRIRNAKRWAPGGWRAYLSALALLSAAFAIRYGLHGLLQSQHAFTLFTASALLVAYYLGLGPALLVAFGGFFLGVYFFVPPYGTFQIPELRDITYVGGYLLICLLGISLIEGLQRSKYALILMRDVLLSRLEMLEHSNAARASFEQMAQKNSERFHSLATDYPHILYMRRVDGEFEYLNQHFYRCSGLAPDSLGPEGWLSAIHPEDIAAVVASCDRVAQSGIEEQMSLRLKTADGPYEQFGGPLSRIEGKHSKDIKWVGGYVFAQESRAQHR